MVASSLLLATLPISTALCPKQGLSNLALTRWASHRRQKHASLFFYPAFLGGLEPRVVLHSHNINGGSRPCSTSSVATNSATPRPSGRPSSHQSKTPPAPGFPLPACPEGDKRPGKRVAASGKPGAPKNKFDTQGQARWSSIHADANGAYNILRKACPSFRRNNGLSSSFRIVRLGPGGLKKPRTAQL